MTDVDQATSLPGVVKAGEIVTLGWNYYEERANILIALIDFDARQDLTDLHGRVLADSPDGELEDFYAKVIERWTVLGYVKEAAVIHEFKGSTVPLSVKDVDTDNWELKHAGEP